MESHRYLTAAGGVPLEVVLQVAVDTDGLSRGCSFG